MPQKTAPLSSGMKIVASTCKKNHDSKTLLSGIKLIKVKKPFLNKFSVVF
jgi:hypothetical protein